MIGRRFANLRRRSLAVPLMACAVLNAASLLAIAFYNPDYLRNYRLNPNPDAAHYVLLGRNIWLQGAYSRSEGPPYVPDIFRTPVYPLFAGGLDILGRPLLVYCVQMILHGLTVLSVYVLADRMYGDRAAFFAALLTAVHPTLIALNVQTMSEALFVLLLVVTALALQSALCSGAGPLPYFAAGCLIGLATLVRPAGLYLPLVLIAYVAVAAARTGRVRDSARRAGALALGATVWIAPWIVRNYAEFGIPTLTTNDTVVLVYFTGAGAFQGHYGIERGAAADLIKTEFGIHSEEDMWNYHSRGLSPAAMDREARRAVIPVLTRFPADLCRSCGLGLTKALFSHDAGIVGRILNIPWHSPGAVGLARFDDRAWEGLLASHPVLISAFIAPFAVNAVLVPLAVVGVVVAVRRGRPATWLSILLMAYFVLTCAASGIDGAYTRFSAPVLPFAAVFAGLAGAQLALRLRAVRMRMLSNPVGLAEESHLTIQGS
jgi:4-amino-4-deoxy-L-arabinose transferase-like glycosyltransferase